MILESNRFTVPKLYSCYAKLNRSSVWLPSIFILLVNHVWLVACLSVVFSEVIRIF